MSLPQCSRSHSSSPARGLAMPPPAHARIPAVDRLMVRLRSSRTAAIGWRPTAREVVVLLMAMGLVWIAARVRTPLLASLRQLAIVLVIVVAIALMAVSTLRCRRRGRLGHAWRAIGFALSVLALFLCGARELAFQQARAMVLQSDRHALARLGAHVIVGYQRIEDGIRLVERRAIAGMFLTARNVRGRSVEAVADDVSRLQSIRQEQGTPALWIAADQEGGQVSRLSPPLTRPLPAASLAGLSSEARRHYAGRVAADLRRVGVNLNLAPVVDVDPGRLPIGDRHTRIARRAIADDVDTITSVASDYCAGLARGGVLCTLKHFPGLGRVRQDTHVRSATLHEPVATLQQSDWVPFRHLTNGSAEIVMLGHVTVADIDPRHAASYSKPVVDGLLRGEWRYRGLLVTDDVCMAAIHDSADGIGGASVLALNAGVDLILVAYDPDQYWFVMQALLIADRKGALDRQQLSLSRQRQRRIESRYLAPLAW